VSTRCVRRCGTQQLAKLRGRSRVERAPSTLCQPGDLPERALGNRVGLLLKHECGYAEEPQFARLRAKIVDRLLHCVPDKDERIDLLLLCLLAHVIEHAADLRMTTTAVDFFHETGKPCRIGNPLRRTAFRDAAIVHKLDIEAAHRRRLLKHFRLQGTGEVPGGLPAHRRIESEDQPPALAVGARPERSGPLHERVDLRARGRLFWRFGIRLPDRCPRLFAISAHCLILGIGRPSDWAFYRPAQGAVFAMLTLR
jgi:hypothetical protein